MRRVDIAVTLNIDPDDWEPELYDAHFGTWLRGLIESEFVRYDPQDISVTVTQSIPE